MTRLSPLHVREDRTLWLDYGTGAGIGPDGHRGSLGATPTLASVLRMVERCAASRVMFTGPTIPRAWFLDIAPNGWTHGAHHLDHETPTGRYRLDSTSAGVVELRRAAEWFGAGDYTPDDARTAWDVLGVALRAQSRTGAALLRSPGATGRDYWLRAAGGEVPDPLDDDTADLIRSTSPQHRIELRPAVTATMPAVWVVDGRWMYAALTRGLGSGPARMLTGAEAADLFAREPYARARYRVRFTASRDYASEPHAAGVLLAKAGPLASDGWHAPMSGETWADASEVHTAALLGWRLDFIEGIAFTPGKPLDTWTDRLVRARDGVRDDVHGETVAGMVRGAVRAVLLHAVGAFHSSGSRESTVTPSPMRAPAGDGWGTPDVLPNGAALWRREVPATGRARLMAHPEWSAQVWGRAHARMLDGPTADRVQRSGLLQLDPSALVSVYGDALMMTRRPRWAAPALDDGRPGRLRLQGHLCGPHPWPATESERAALTHAAKASGTTCTNGCE